MGVGEGVGGWRGLKVLGYFTNAQAIMSKNADFIEFVQNPGGGVVTGLSTLTLKHHHSPLGSLSTIKGPFSRNA